MAAALQLDRFIASTPVRIARALYQLGYTPQELPDAPYYQQAYPRQWETLCKEYALLCA